LRQGILTEPTQMMTYREREAPRFLHRLDPTNDVEQYFSVKTLHIRLLGEFVLLANEMPITSLDVPRLQSLLAYLVLHRGLPQARSRVAYTLWPDSTDAQAHTNLRNALFRLRVALPQVERFLFIERQTLCWRLDAHFRLDVMEFEGAMARAEQARCAQDQSGERQALEAAVQCYQGDLLPGCYDEWILAERDRLQQVYIGGMERLIELLEEEGCSQAAIRVAQRLLRLDPLHEASYRCLMRPYAARGDRAAVWRTYQTCVTVLKRELAIEPGLTTRTTYERLMRAEDQPSMTRNAS